MMDSNYIYDCIREEFNKYTFGEFFKENVEKCLKNGESKCAIVIKEDDEQYILEMNLIKYKGDIKDKYPNVKYPFSG